MTSSLKSRYQKKSICVIDKVINPINFHYKVFKCCVLYEFLLPCNQGNDWVFFIIYKILQEAATSLSKITIYKSDTNRLTNRLPIQSKMTPSPKIKSHIIRLKIWMYTKIKMDKPKIIVSKHENNSLNNSL